MQARRITWLAIAMTAIITVPMSAQAAMKCWTNKDGVRECGNVVPPEYAQQETRTISNRGITVEVKERAKTPEEVEQERILREAEEKRLAEEARRQKAHLEYDRMLLSTYTSEAEIISARDRKLSSIDAIISITKAGIEGLQKKNSELMKRAAQLERSGKPLTDEVKEDMASLEKQIADKEKYIEFQNAEKKDLTVKYEMDIQRFRELQNIRPGAH